MVTFVYPVHAANDKTDAVQQAEQQFVAGHYAEAQQLLTPLADDMAGNIRFDYLYGRVALQNQDFRTAITALMRVISVDPGFAGARIELARTYYAQGVKQFSRSSLEESRAEFRTALKQAPPETMRVVINDYLASIQRHLDVKSLLYTAYLDVGAGIDSNVNSGPMTSAINLNSIYYTLPAKTTEAAAFFAETLLGGSITFPLRDKDIDLFASVDAGARALGSNVTQDWSYNYASVNLGLRHYGEHNRKTLMINPTSINQGNHRYMDSFFVDGRWEQLLGKQDRLTYRLVGGEIHYDYLLSPHSNDGPRGSVAWTHLNDDAIHSSTELLLQLGHDGTPQCNSGCVAPLAHSLAGIGTSYTRDWLSTSRLNLSAYLELSDFGDTLFYNSRRKDNRLETFAGLSTPLSPGLSLREEIYWVYSDSNVDLYDFRRFTAKVNLRWSL